MSLNRFHRVVSRWFEKSFQSPANVQAQAWESIKTGDHTLIVAPTGSGKTLAAFLSAIDELVRQGLQGKLEPVTQVVYVSPLKALSNDIERNLQLPLKGIKKELEDEGLPPAAIRVLVRTGDTTAAERAGMIKHPPHILVTTPESLYLLLTSINGRRMLGNVHTLIIDEIHALVGNKRGSHLALSVERLEALTTGKLQRIGLSATQKPVEEVARFLTGSPTGQPVNCRIIDAGHSRKLDLSVEVPRSPLTATMASEVWEEIYDRLIKLIATHQTTLIFVNTRRLAERLSHNLNERLGPGRVLAHHGSMSKERRLDAESKLKNGSLKALVATASMELGIDVGAIDLVCQISTPHSIATFLQRVGRSGHSVNKTPKGILFPLTLDELVDCVAILDAIRQGELDRIIIPEKPLDVLAQQIVAETVNREYTDEELFSLVAKAYPYHNLTRKEFDEVVNMLTEGYTSRRGRRGAYLYHDRINQRIRARKGARLAATISGGAIPDNFEFDVVMEPENIFLGTVNEDFAMESIPGDIFQLGNNSWKITRIENGKVRVADAAGQPPNIPFWLGEAPARTPELSFAVSRLREEVAEKIDNAVPGKAERQREETVDWLVRNKEISSAAAEQLADYLAAAKAALKAMPSQEEIVMERFFDDAGDMHLVIHSPFGSRLNKAWGLALRKRFCRQFNFELQAAANDNAILLSLGPTHSFPLEDVFNYLHPGTVRNILIQATFDAPVFQVRWRWNASCALAVIRRSGGKKIPAQLQRMQAEDLVAQVFPDQLACFENIAGDREIPDHPLINQTIHDCLYEAMDIEGLERLLQKIKNKTIRLVARNLKEPSPLAHEIIMAKPYAFLDDAPIEERRTLAVRTRRWLSPADAADIGKLDPQAIQAVKNEASPKAESADELHDALLLSCFLTREETEGKNWEPFFKELVCTNRATMLVLNDSRSLLVAAENLPLFRGVYPEKKIQPEIAIPGKLNHALPPEKDPLTELVRGRLEMMGPTTSEHLSQLMLLPATVIEQALYRLENEGFVLRGNYSGTNGTEWCERRLLARIHRYTVRKLRSEVQPVSPADYMRFLLSWQQTVPGSQGQGPVALEHVLQKLEGFEAPAAAWEGDLLPARIADYDYQWLDLLCVSGKITWGRFRNSGAADKERKAAPPVKTTPIAFVSRQHLDNWKNSQHGMPDALVEVLSPKARQLFLILRSQGALFFDDMISKTGLFQSQAEEVLGELISSGLVTSDSFTGLRALLVPNKYKTRAGSRRGPELFSMSYAGRWALLIPREEDEQQDQQSITETIAWALLRRYGILFRKLAEKENLAPSWRELVRVLRRLELQGQIRGGRFIEGVWGEQFALPEAITELRRIMKTEKSGVLVSVSAADPLNLTGVLTPGKRVPGYFGNRILYRDGIPVAFQEAKEIQFLIEPGPREKWDLQNKLVQRSISPVLRKYLGKGVF